MCSGQAAPFLCPQHQDEALMLNKGPENKRFCLHNICKNSPSLVYLHFYVAHLAQFTILQLEHI